MDPIDHNTFGWIVRKLSIIAQFNSAHLLKYYILL